MNVNLNLKNKFCVMLGIIVLFFFLSFTICLWYSYYNTIAKLRPQSRNISSPVALKLAVLFESNFKVLMFNSVIFSVGDNWLLILRRKRYKFRWEFPFLDQHKISNLQFERWGCREHVNHMGAIFFHSFFYNYYYCIGYLSLITFIVRF